MAQQLVLPEDILAHIHSLMAMRDAARAACVSRVFLRSWRRYPKLNFDMEALGLEEELSFLFDELPMEDEQQEFVARVDHIMHKHSGTGVTKFRLRPPHGVCIDPATINRWSEAVMKPGITEFELELLGDDDGWLLQQQGRGWGRGGYSFPCSLLLSAGPTITRFTIAGCGLQSHDAMRAASCCCLSRAHLHNMRLTAEQLGCFLAACPALEQLQLSYCHDMLCLNIPHHPLSRLRLLQVRNCSSLQMIRCDAPKLESFRYLGSPTLRVLFLGASSPVTEMKMMSGTEDEPGMLRYGTTNLPAVVPNLRSLLLSSCFEAADTPPALGKFHHLNFLEIQLHKPSRCPDYDFCSLVSFLDASPALETFILSLEMPDDAATNDSIIPGESSHGGQGKSSSGDQLKTAAAAAAAGGGGGNGKLTTVLISGFSSAKGMVELTGHILDKAAPLKYLILDTSYGCNRGRRRHSHTTCPPLTTKALVEAPKALDAIKRCILGKVPSTVKFGVIQPCSKCHKAR